MALPKVKIIATGGTIAGSSPNCTDMTGYTAGGIGVDDLIEAVPALQNFADVSGEQLCNINSSSITIDIWLRLNKRVNELLARQDVDGIVITHGTDTLEETAYFLNLTVKSHKPVVIVGAMRPATAMSADGPLNLLQAVQLAVSSEARGQGVLVLLNGEINAAADVLKTHSLAVQTFRSVESGALGYMLEGNPIFWRQTTRLHTLDTVFDVRELEKLPYVTTVYGQAADDDILVNAVLAAGAKGIVFAGMGNGNIHEETEPALRQAVQKGVLVVISSRTGSGIVTEDKNKVEEYGFLYSGFLPPSKARVLLMLALTVTDSREQIREFFKVY